MGRSDLLTLWQGLNGTPAPPKISQSMMRRILAFDVQSRALGGLPKGFLAQLERALPDTRRAPVMATGTRFMREWNGVTHVVEKAAGGYLWGGAKHASLSAIAERITGAHWSGPRFFGVKSIPIAKVKKGNTP